MAEEKPELIAKVLDLLLDTVCVVDTNGRFVFTSASSEQVFGYTPEELRGRNMVELIHPDDLERTLASAAEVMAGKPGRNFENRYLRKDGETVHIMWSARWSEIDQVRIAVARDVTERRRAESLQSAVYEISEAAHSTDNQMEMFERIHRIIGRLLPAKNFFIALYDQRSDELSFPYYVDEHDMPPGPGPLDSGTLSAEVIRTGRTLLLTPESSLELPLPLRRSVGTEPMYWLGVPLTSQQGTFGALAVQSYGGGSRYSQQDLDLLQFVSAQIAAAIERKRLHARLQYVALYDSLTDLPNRELFNDRLGVALGRAHREHRQLSLLFLDLDGFKKINDSLGHAVGDVLLQTVARRLSQSVRATDTVARLGGDEFVLLLEGLHCPEDSARIAEKLRLALVEPMLLDGHEVQVTPSIGIAHYPGNGDDERSLLHAADTAMYLAKRGGGNQVHGLAPTPDAGVTACNESGHPKVPAAV